MGSSGLRHPLVPAVLSVGLLLGAAGLYRACSEAPGPDASAVSLAKGRELGPSSPVAFPRGAPDRAGLDLPGAGEMRIELSETGLLVLANEVMRLDLLRALSARLGFELKDRARRHPWVSVALVNASLEEVLAEVLSGTPYNLSYGLAPDGQRVVVTAVEVLRDRRAPDEGQTSAKAPKPGSEKRSPDGTLKQEVKGGADEQSREEAERLARSELARRLARERQTRLKLQMREELPAELESGEPEDRAFAAASLDAELPEDRRLLRQILLNDPDPLVRAEAALQLGFGRPDEVVPLLSGALADPSPDVIVAAVESLSFLEDRTTLARLRGLMGHPDDRVKDAAEDAVQLLELLP